MLIGGIFGHDVRRGGGQGISALNNVRFDIAYECLVFLFIFAAKAVAERSCAPANRIDIVESLDGFIYTSPLVFFASQAAKTQ